MNFMPQMVATDTIEIGLTAAEWNQVMQIMAQAPIPHCVVDPLLRAIQRQCLAAVEAGDAE